MNLNKIAIYIGDLSKETFKNERILNEDEVFIARFLRIKDYAKVKVVEISRDEFRNMLNDETNMLLEKFDLIKANTNAITLGNMIIIFKSEDVKKTIAHELVHVFQYETLGVKGFVQEYMKESIGTKNKKSIQLETPAYYFGKDYKYNNYSVENLKIDKYILIPA